MDENSIVDKAHQVPTGDRTINQKPAHRTKVIELLTGLYHKPGKLIIALISGSIGIFAGIAGIIPLIQYWNDVPGFHVVPVALILGVGKDIKQNPSAHDVALVMPAVIFNTGQKNLHLYDLRLEITLDSGRLFELKTMRTPREIFDTLKEKANLDDAYKELHDLSQDTNPIAADTGRYGYVCFHGEGLSFEDLDRSRSLKASMTCKTFGSPPLTANFELKNMNTTGEPRIENVSIIEDGEQAHTKGTTLRFSKGTFMFVIPYWL